MRFALRPLLAATMLAAGIAAAPATQAALIIGDDFGGSNLTLNNGDILSGAFTNVGALSIDAGITVFVDPGSILSVSAGSINIAGILNGTGAGFAGGAAVPNDTSGCPPFGTPTGIAGGGPGGGGAGLFGCNVHGSGGGGGGHGGAGGNSSAALSNPGATPGGVAYGSPSSASVDMGSGGGSGSRYNEATGSSGAGGWGGGAISLTAGLIELSGAILADGAGGNDGVPSWNSTSAGGGGAGGSILLSGLLNLDGLLSATGGDGGNGNTTPFGSGGGGGGGGRIKLFGSASFGAGFSFDVTGGAGGNFYRFSGEGAPSVAGAAGSFFDATTAPVPEPGSLALLGLGIAALGALRRRV